MLAGYFSLAGFSLGELVLRIGGDVGRKGLQPFFGTFGPNQRYDIGFVLYSFIFEGGSDKIHVLFHFLFQSHLLGADLLHQHIVVDLFFCYFYLKLM